MAFTPFRDMTPTEQAVWDRITADRPTGDFKAASGTGWKSDPSKSVHDDMNDWLVSRGARNPCSRNSKSTPTTIRLASRRTLRTTMPGCGKRRSRRRPKAFPCCWIRAFG